MASSRRRRHSSVDERPSIEEFIRLYERDHLELQQCIKRLSHLVKTFEEDFRCASEASRYGGIAGVVGRVAMIAGAALAPFTLGASAVVGGAGAAVALGGEISGGIFNFMKMNQQKKLSQNIINGLEKFQNKIIPLADIMKGICQYNNEIQSHLNKPVFSGFSKSVASTSELARFICVGDIGEVVAQMSKTVRLTGTLTTLFAGIVLNIISVIDDNEALNDMDNLAKNGQISESEIKSNAGKFIVEMRKVIQGLQNIMDDLKKTKDIIEKVLKSKSKTKSKSKSKSESKSERASGLCILCLLLLSFVVASYMFSVLNL
ncbi:hypothetical protein ABG768_015794 [Culter alburnus]|uniref:Uncharacterized protein n=1 Tax=Culter alburnus TaxID=194366 RepID=A0AAW1Z3I5_CULAL